MQIIFNLLTGVSGICWTVVFLLCLILGFWKKTFGMPLIVTSFMISWLAVYSYMDMVVHESRNALSILHLLWLILCLGILVTWILFGRKENHNPDMPSWFPFLWCAMILLAAFALQILFLNEFGYSDGKDYSLFLIYLMTSIGLIRMFQERGGMKGQSRIIAVAKCVGTLSAAIDGTFDKNWFILVIGGICFAFDMFYIFMLDKQVDANQALLAGEKEASSEGASSESTAAEGASSEASASGEDGGSFAAGAAFGAEDSASGEKKGLFSKLKWKRKAKKENAWKYAREQASEASSDSADKTGGGSFGNNDAGGVNASEGSFGNNNAGGVNASGGSFADDNTGGVNGGGETSDAEHNAEGKKSKKGGLKKLRLFGIKKEKKSDNNTSAKSAGTDAGGNTEGVDSSAAADSGTIFSGSGEKNAFSKNSEKTAFSQNSETNAFSSGNETNAFSTDGGEAPGFGTPGAAEKTDVHSGDVNFILQDEKHDDTIVRFHSRNHSGNSPED